MCGIWPFPKAAATRAMNVKVDETWEKEIAANDAGASWRRKACGGVYGNDAAAVKEHGRILDHPRGCCGTAGQDDDRVIRQGDIRGRATVTVAPVRAAS